MIDGSCYSVVSSRTTCYRRFAVVMVERRSQDHQHQLVRFSLRSISDHPHFHLIPIPPITPTSVLVADLATSTLQYPTSNTRRSTLPTMADQETPVDDDLSGLSGFFFYMFIVHPATAWLLQPGRFPRKKSILYAVAFLAAIASIKTGMYVIRSL